MTKVTKYFFLLIAVLSVTMILMGVIVRRGLNETTYNDILKESSKFSFTLFNSANDVTKEYAKLNENESEVVVGRFTGKRQVFSSALLSEVEVISSNNKSINKYIYVFEKLIINEPTKNIEIGVIISDWGYLPMKEGSTYLLSVTKNTNNRYYSKDRNTYNLSNDVFGKVPVENNEKMFLVKNINKENAYFSDVYEYEQIFNSDKAYKDYKDFRKDILEKNKEILNDLD